MLIAMGVFALIKAFKKVSKNPTDNVMRQDFRRKISELIDAKYLRLKLKGKEKVILKLNCLKQDRKY